MSVAIRLCLIALAMTAFLAFMVTRQATLRAGGTEIILPMEPVDPRDVLLGYYIVIATPAHRLQTDELAGPVEGWSIGDTAYVVLNEGADGAWRPVGVWPQRPLDGVFLKGRVQSAHTLSDRSATEPVDGEAPDWTARQDVIPGAERQVLSLRFNLERYYANASSAGELDRLRGEDRLRLIVAVAADGSAVIKGLEVDGQARYETLF
jgi:uncharacterized membrane-anchored protein